LEFIEKTKKISAMLYTTPPPPVGNRGVGLGCAQNYGVGFEEYKKWADKETIFIP